MNTWSDISKRNKFRSESIIICVFDQKFYEDNMILKQSMNKILFEGKRTVVAELTGN